VRVGHWWVAAKWAAIISPVAWWCGSRAVQLCGWIVAGFVRPDPEHVPQDIYEAAENVLLKQIVVQDGLDAARVWKAHQWSGKYFTYLAWVLAWLAADQAEHFVLYLQLGDLAWRLPNGVTLDDLRALIPSYWLWAARALLGSLTFIILTIVFFLGRMVIHDVLIRKLRHPRPDLA
jgi:hypothetical protein